MPGAPEIPLARLFALASRQLVERMHALLAARGWKDIRSSYGYVLLAVRQAPRSTTALAALLGISKQAASKLVGEMEAARLVSHRPLAGSGRSKVVALTARGKSLLDVVEQIYAELEEAWGRTLGADRLKWLREDLRQMVLEDGGTRLPDIRPL